MSRLQLSHTGRNLLSTQVRTTGVFNHTLARPSATGRTPPVHATLETQHTDRHLAITVRIEGTTNTLRITKISLRDTVRNTLAFIENCANGMLDTAEVAA